MQKFLKIFYFFLLLFSFSNFPILSNGQKSFSESGLNDERIEIKIGIKYEPNIVIGEKNIFYLQTDFDDSQKNYFNPSDIEEETSFITSLVDYNTEDQSYIIICRLWKPINNNIKLLS